MLQTQGLTAKHYLSCLADSILLLFTYFNVYYPFEKHQGLTLSLRFI